MRGGIFISVLVKKYNFDNLFIGFMKNFLRINKYGVDSYVTPDIKNKNVKQYFIDAFETLNDYHPFLVFDLIIESKKMYLLSNYKFNEEEIMQLLLIQRGMKWIIEQDYESILDTVNLWNSSAHEYAVCTFYYHVPIEIKKKCVIPETNPQVLNPDNF